MFVAAGGVAQADVTASPVTAEPTGTVRAGKLVWADLVTTDLEAAAAFYTGVFGWETRRTEDRTYLELTHQGRTISSIVLFEEDEASPGNAYWLVSISVEDVDAAARRASDAGGTVLVAPTDFDDRGRFALIRDPQGAEVMVLRAAGGDPLDQQVMLDEWAWAELWTSEPDAAAGFYQALAGYSRQRIPDGSGEEQILLSTDGMARATIVRIPFEGVMPNWLAYIPVADLDSALQRVTQAGGALLVRSDADDEDQQAAVVMDPTGGVFAIQQVGPQ